MKKVIVAVLTRGLGVTIPVGCWFELGKLFGQIGVHAQYMTSIGAADVSAGRDQLTARVVQEAADAVVFIDDDMSFDAEAVLQLLGHLQRHPIVAAVGRTKGRNSRFAWQAMPDGLLAQGLVEAHAVGAAFMAVRMDALRQIWQMQRDRRPYTNHGIECAPVWPSGAANGGWCGEDMGFCGLARMAGYRVMVDPSIALGHWGLECWAGRLSDTLEAPCGS